MQFFPFHYTPKNRHKFCWCRIHLDARALTDSSAFTDAYTHAILQSFIKKFLRYVSKIRPRISDESSERISTMYMELRGSNDIASGVYARL